MTHTHVEGLGPENYVTNKFTKIDKELILTQLQ